MTWHLKPVCTMDMTRNELRLDSAYQQMDGDLIDYDGFYYKRNMQTRTSNRLLTPISALFIQDIKCTFNVSLLLFWLTTIANDALLIAQIVMTIQFVVNATRTFNYQIINVQYALLFAMNVFKMKLVKMQLIRSVGGTNYQQFNIPFNYVDIRCRICGQFCQECIEDQNSDTKNISLDV
ncbi:unnamed protein product (macronuclear) [Paramecium tetraurelia]|uniref:Uncharacterized protein n=1 Tax=Paramecium tetraurelia TaxID=5888 RepID=A0CGG2_PARTE|nr:uncharacterized protein GSPATT00007319001 [Paramecium tetraurelia]CAK69879.1 unnamed protein product [Paramecium tetraurelia]|eukprot:XP_001437276.1 hypothetical protein (macronuclear) [Paramecium tetraurelia strain d4-2]